jgi:hypothetical protein
MYHHPMLDEILVNAANDMKPAREPRTRPGDSGNQLLKGFVTVVALTIVASQMVTFGRVVRTSVAVRRMADFGVFYRSADLAVRGQNPYDIIASPPTGDDMRTPNLNPPHAIVLMTPLRLFERPAALAIWLFASGCCAFIACRIIFREIGIQPTPHSMTFALFMLSCAAATGALVMSFQLGWLLWAPAAWAWSLARRGRWNAAAVTLGILASIKPFLGLFVLSFLVRKQRREAFVTAVTAATCMAAGVVALGWGAFVSWMRTVASIQWMDHIFNTSVIGFFDRLFTDRGIVRAWDLAPVARRPALGAICGLVCAITILAISMRSLRPRHSSGGQDSTAGVDRFFALTVVASLLIAPLGWIYYQFFAAAPVAALLADTRWRVSLRSRATLLVPGAVCLMLSPAAMVASQPSPWATASIGSAYFWGTLAFWWCLLTPIDTQSFLH